MPGTTTTILALFGFWAFFSQLYHAPQQARLVALLPEYRVILLALNASSLHTGISLGSFLGSALLSSFDPKALSAFGLVPAAVAGVAHLVSARRINSSHPL
ncbi:hypothetical protein V5P93_002410 [Actinokineospora auranticolor]|uniref:hypothetical protein n=1 Tax=Actinokineospora auranticolor TaxID=155976 RepID=UPI001FE6D6E7|nr:hypothetical protein [Actinokineospora auranticolor]